MLTQALVAESMKKAQEGERLSSQALTELQERKLRELTQFAVAHSPFYYRLYQSIDLHSASVTDLPPVNKEMIQKNFDQVVTDQRLTLSGMKHFCQESTPQSNPWYLGEFAVFLTSGTTGLRGYYVYDAQTLADAIAIGFRQSHRPSPGSGAPMKQRVAAIIQVDTCDITNILLNLIPESVGVKQLIDIRQDFSAICRQLNEFKPTLLAAYPYMLWLLSEAKMAGDGKLTIAPKRITSSADVLADSDRRAIRTAFGAEPYNFYCSTEFAYLAWECDAHAGLHVNADYFLVESVDSQNRPIPAGTLGDKVLVTNLSNRAMPLIRYEMSDQVEYTTTPCSCGCLLPRVRTVAGREEHILALPGLQGTRVRLLEDQVDDMVGTLEAVARYQVIQEDATHLTVNVIGREPATWQEVRSLVLERLEHCFRKYGVDPNLVQLDLRPVKELEPITPGSKKVCRFWNRCR